MAAITFPTSSSPGKVPHEGGGRLVNVYWEALAANARGQRVWRRAPGLAAWSAATGQTGHRGSILIGSSLFSAFSGNASYFSSAGAITNIGTLTGTRGVFWARNLKVPTPDLVVVDPDNGASIVTSSSVASYNASGILPQPNSVCFQDGYFFFTIGDGRCFATDLNATTMNALTFITCEGKSGSLLRAIPFTDLYLFKTDSIEVWHDTAETAPAFPYSRLKVIPKGLLSRYGVSGFEDGFAKGIVFVGSDRVVYALNGYTPVKVSTPDVDRAIDAYIDGGGSADGIQMFPYIVGGHSVVVMTSPSWTWFFDIDTVSWFERASYQAVNWRANFSLFAFNKWLAGDSVSNTLVQITESALTEVGSPLAFWAESGPVSDFPQRMAVPMATFDMAQGVGIATGADPIATDPTAEISYSDDGGVNWTNSRLLKLGRQGETRDPLKLPKCGMTKTMGRRWRVVVTDPVNVELIAADQLSEVRTA